jgi:hypothetical protein
MRGQPKNSVLLAPRLQVVQSGQNLADRVKCDLNIEHDQYLTLIIAQVHLVQLNRAIANIFNAQRSQNNK